MVTFQGRWCHSSTAPSLPPFRSSPPLIIGAGGSPGSFKNQPVNRHRAGGDCEPSPLCCAHSCNVWVLMCVGVSCLNVGVMCFHMWVCVCVLWRTWLRFVFFCAVLRRVWACCWSVCLHDVCWCVRPPWLCCLCAHMHNGGFCPPSQLPPETNQAESCQAAGQVGTESVAELLLF